jgi:long-chain fatty acid transport protein
MKMKKTIKLALVAAMALGTTSAFATNGSTMNGLGAKTRGMAGIGIGMGHGAESILANPAFISGVQGTEISFGGTLFMPDVTNTNALASPLGVGPTNVSKSTADTFVIPSVSVSHKVNDNFYTGIGMWGTGGLGVDYRGTAASTVGGSQMQMVTSLQIMQFGVPLVYRTGSFSVGVTPIVQYGTLDIHYANPMAGDAGVGAGVGSDIATGYNIGASYTMNDLTLGVVYKSKIDMNYDGQLRAAISPMIGGTANYDAMIGNDALSTPAEMGVGFSYSMNEHTIAMDYKVIKWEDALGYKDFGWENQKVVAVGYQYKTDGWSVRMGYSKADSAVQDNTGKVLTLDNMFNQGAGFPAGTAALTNTFNALGFPGNVEKHYAIGGTYDISKTISIDVAYMYAPESTSSFNPNFAGQPIKTDHSEKSLSAQLNLAF